MLGGFFKEDENFLDYKIIKMIGKVFIYYY